MKKWIEMVILAVLVIGMVLMSGCIISQSTDTAAPITSQSTNDYKIIQQGINNSQGTCLSGLARNVSTDECIINLTEQKKIIDTITLKLNEKEQDCLNDLPRSKEPSLCTVNDKDKMYIGTRVANRYIIFNQLNIKESIEENVDNRIDSLIFLPYST